MLDEDLAHFPYINGDLFRGQLRIPACDATLRHNLIEACLFDWGKVSPAIFGSLFQSVMERAVRRQQGAHYTPEKNILKVIEPLFLDELRSEFERVRRLKTNRRRALQAFHERLGRLRFLDPACGCGNFLIIAYRELRRLEIEVLREIYPEGQRVLNIASLCTIDVDQFYGIEIGEFPCRIAETALWMMDHIMNNAVSLAFGQLFVRIPLQKSPHILHADALETDWNDHLLPAHCDYLFGNPPFGGAKYQTKEQRVQVRRIADLRGSGGTLDYVTAWFLKAGEYLQSGRAKIGFVATNSITQGEQVGQIWPLLFDRFTVEIAFAHRTFAWGSDARGTAPLRYGSQPIDGGHYIFTAHEKEQFVAAEPGAAAYMRPYIGSREFLQGGIRWILRLAEAEPQELKAMPLVKERIIKVKKYREGSKREGTRALAATPTKFAFTAIPDRPFLVVPEVSSERRDYAPIGWLEPPVIPSNLVRIVEMATLDMFALLTSAMHMAWMRAVTGRLKSDYRYSIGVVYNTFPAPTMTENQRAAIGRRAQALLDARAAHPDATLADLYDPDLMPPDLRRAHNALDRAVDRLYSRAPFHSERERVEHLFARYEKMTLPLSAKPKGRRNA